MNTGAGRDRITTSDGLQLAVFRHGEPANPTVLLVHGFPDDHHAWDGVVERLADEHHVVTYDVRGTGESSKPARIADYRVEQLADDLQAVIDHVGGPGVHLVGHDWGSVQGWHLVTDPTHRGVLSYTSISGPCLDHLPGWIRRKASAGRWRDIAAIWKSPLYMGVFALPGIAPALARSGLIDRTLTLSVRAFERPEPLRREPAGPSARRNHASIRLYAANLLPRLRKHDRGGTDVPVQILTPVNDVFIPPVSQRDPHPDVRTVEIHQLPGGHWAPTYNPDATAGALTEWVARWQPAVATRSRRKR